ncbi:MAG: hypothetical protein DYH08_04010 [Actinobacteria bacterium ATB1]|nr:hypothetical protein [Actinobacteria bacterium ATB1]
MQATLDSSTLISLSKAGLLLLLDRAPFEVVIPASVHQECVTDGRAGGHPDATAIETALHGADIRTDEAERRKVAVDVAVIQLARETGTLVANDLALGRRARNSGVRWLRTVDLVRVLHEIGRLTQDEARAAIVSLRDSCRITPDLAQQHLEELEEVP